jgi:hypothetical protein
MPSWITSLLKSPNKISDTKYKCGNNQQHGIHTLETVYATQIHEYNCSTVHNNN